MNWFKEANNYDNYLAGIMTDDNYYAYIINTGTYLDQYNLVRGSDSIDLHKFIIKNHYSDTSLMRMLASNNTISEEIQSIILDLTISNSDKYPLKSFLATNPSTTHKIQMRLFKKISHDGIDRQLEELLVRNINLSPKIQLAFTNDIYNKRIFLLCELAKNPSVIPEAQKYLVNYKNAEGNKKYEEMVLENLATNTKLIADIQLLIAKRYYENNYDNIDIINELSKNISTTEEVQIYLINRCIEVGVVPSSLDDTISLICKNKGIKDQAQMIVIEAAINKIIPPVYLEILSKNTSISHKAQRAMINIDYSKIEEVRPSHMRWVSYKDNVLSNILENDNISLEALRLISRNNKTNKIKVYSKRLKKIRADGTTPFSVHRNF